MTEITENSIKENNTTENNTTKNSTEKQKKKVTSKQIAAIVGVVLLAAMYLVTLIAALTDRAGTMTLFRACLIATAAIPLLLWIYIWIYGKATGRHTMADFDLGKKPSEKEDR